MTNPKSLLQRSEVLTDQTILELTDGFNTTEESHRRFQRDDTFIKTVRAVYEWGNEPCPHRRGSDTETLKHECSLCWAAFPSLAKP